MSAFVHVSRDAARLVKFIYLTACVSSSPHIQVITDNDSLAAHLAAEAGADLMIMMSNVDGVYTLPPGKGAAFHRYVSRTASESLEKFLCRVCALPTYCSVQENFFYFFFFKRAFRRNLFNIEVSISGRDGSKLLHTYSPNFREKIVFGEKSNVGMGGMESKISAATWALERGEHSPHLKN